MLRTIRRSAVSLLVLDISVARVIERYTAYHTHFGDERGVHTLSQSHTLIYLHAHNPCFHFEENDICESNIFSSLLYVYIEKDLNI